MDRRVYQFHHVCIFVPKVGLEPTPPFGDLLLRQACLHSTTSAILWSITDSNSALRRKGKSFIKPLHPLPHILRPASSPFKRPMPRFFEQVMGIEPTYPAWKAGILTVVLHLLVKYTRTDRTRTGTDCRIKTFRSTVLHLQGTHPFPLLIQFVAGVYQFPLTVLVYLCCWLDSNQRPSVYQTDALKTN